MKTWNPVAKIGVVVHGPEVIDSGAALYLLNLLEKFGPVEAVLGGTMGRVAAIDSGLAGRLDITRRELPSLSAQRLASQSEILVLCNQAKSMESAVAFGTAVCRNADVSCPFIQVDFGAMFVARLSGHKSIEHELSKETGLGLIYFPAQKLDFHREDDTGIERRMIYGLCPGEPVTINGIVVGVALQSKAEISCLHGKVVGMMDIRQKPHGLEKLPLFDIKTAIIRSGLIRRASRPGSMKVSDPRGLDVVVIDHCAEDAFELAAGAAAVIAVGDDTTAVCAEVLSRLGVPVIGIVDGDADGILRGNASPKCTMLQVEPGFDDLVGREVKERITGGFGRAALNGDLEALVELIAGIAGNYLITVRCAEGKSCLGT